MIASQVATSCGALFSMPADMAITLTVATGTDVFAGCSRLPGADSKPLPGACSLCPHIAPQTDYVVAVVADNGPPSRIWALSSIALVNVSTADVVPPSFTLGPNIVSIETDSLAMRFALSEDGSVDYVVAYAALQAPFYSSYVLSFAQSQYSAQQIVDQVESVHEHIDGIVASGSITAEANRTVVATIAPDCRRAACLLPENVNRTNLAPATDYILHIVARDASGNVYGETSVGASLTSSLASVHAHARGGHHCTAVLRT